jgi:hypothetical protein
MPVSSLSGALSTSVYFASMLLLLGVLIPPVRTAYGDADLAASRHLAASIAGQIDDLSPGMTSVLKFSSFPGVAESVALSGFSVTATVDGISASDAVTWAVPTLDLSADHAYVVEISGGALELA